MAVRSAQEAFDGGGMDQTLWDIAEGCQEAAVTLEALAARDIRAARRRKAVLLAAQRRNMRRLILIAVLAALSLTGAALLLMGRL